LRRGEWIKNTKKDVNRDEGDERDKKKVFAELTILVY
jgi:hypothetical protein